MSAGEKVVRLVESLSSAADDLEVFAKPDANSIIDTINRETGLTRICGLTEAQVIARDPGAVRMTWEAWRAAAIARQETPIRWDRTTRERWISMLEVLPPIDFNGRDFLVGEPWDHSFRTGAPRFAAYRMVGSSEDFAVYLVASRPLTRAELRAELTGGRVTIEAPR